MPFGINILRHLKVRDISSVDKGAGEGVEVVLSKRAADYETFLKGKYSAEDRRQMAANGEAMKDGSYPIKDAKDLSNAIHAVGRGKNNSHTAIREHIKRRAKALGLEDKLPDTYDKCLTITKSAGGYPKVSAEGNTCQISEQAAEFISKIGLADDGARSFDANIDGALEDAEMQQLWWKATDALYRSIISIITDDNAQDKNGLIEQSLQQFADFVSENAPTDNGNTLAAGVAAVASGAGITLKGDRMLSEAIKKALGLPATATEDEVLKALEKGKKDKDEAEKAACLAKMSDEHKKFMDHPKAKMPDGGKDAFIRMSAADRDKHIEDHPLPETDDEVEKALKSGNAFRTPEGVVVSKRAVGESVFNVLKAQNATLVAQAEELKKRRDADEERAFAKRATDAGLAEDMGTTLRKAYAGDPAAQKALENQIMALRNQADTGGVFSEIGKASHKSGTAEGELWAKADELRKAETKLTREQAFSKVYSDKANADIVKRYRTETNA